MNTVKRIAKNSGASLLSQISTPASSFLLVFFIARNYGVSGLGTFASALSMLYVFQAFTSLGFQYLITREVAQDKSKASKFLTNASLLGVVFSILMTGIMCVSMHFITDNVDIINAVYVLSVSLVPYSLALVCQSVCRAFEKLEYNAISLISGNIFKVLVGLLIILNGYNLSVLMGIIVASHFLIFFINLYYTLKCIPEKHFVVDFGFCKWIIQATPVFALIFIFSAVRRNIDVLILTNMMGATDVGFYSAAYKLVNLCMLSVSCYIFAVQPIIFRLFKSSLEQFKIICEDSIRYLFILSLPIVVGTMLLSDNFILLIFNENFLPSASVLNILIWLLILTSFNQIFANALIASNYQKVNLQANLIGMIANICINLILIPVYGYFGAGIACIVSAFTTLLYQYYFVSRHLFKVDFLHFIKKPFVAAILMGTVIILFKDINLILLVALSALVYMLSVYMLRVFSSRDIDLVRKLWEREDKTLGVTKT